MTKNNQRYTDDYREEGIASLNKARNHFWYLHRNRIIEDLIDEFQKEKNLRRTPCILELGAGSGNISSYLFTKGYTIIASDFYRSGVDIIEYNGIKAFQYDLANNALPLHKEHLNAYDIVILGDVIEHLDDPVEALKNVKTFLRKGGRVMITVPALSILWTQYDIYCGHKRRYSIQLLSKHIRAAGYAPIKVRYFMLLPAIILFVTRKIKDTFTPYDTGMLYTELHLNSATNAFMKILMAVEYKFQKLINVPFGSSVYGIGEVEK